MNKELQNLLTDLEKFIYQSEKDKFTLDVHQVHLILDHIANQGEKIERLNNIIDELEKDLLEKQEFYRNELSTRPTNDSEHNTKFADSCALTQIDVILDKLKEFKENKTQEFYLSDADNKVIENQVKNLIVDYKGNIFDYYDEEEGTNER